MNLWLQNKNVIVASKKKKVYHLIDISRGHELRMALSIENHSYINKLIKEKAVIVHEI